MKKIFDNDMRKLVTLSLFSAIGILLMVFIEIDYPLAPYLKIEFSDLVVLLALVIYGPKEAIMVAIIKTLGDAVFQGVNTPYAIGHITAFISSMSYVMFYSISKRIIKSDQKISLVLRYVFVIICVCITLTTANYFLITPIFNGVIFWFQLEDGLSFSYFIGIVSLYIPFNLCKGLSVILIFALLVDRIKKIAKKEESTNACVE